MKGRRSRFCLLAIFVAITAVFFITFGCEPPAEGPSDPGDFTECSYTSGLSDSGYSDAIVYYPCETESGPFAATTVTGGFTNTYSDMDWLSEHLVTHGYIVIAMTPNNTLGNNPQWTTAHKAGIAKLQSENSRLFSPINGLVNTSALQIMGYSKGGGGALLAASDLGAQVKTTQAMAPYMDGSYNLSGIASDTICYTGTDDIVASPGAVVNMYNSLPDDIDRTLAYFDGFGHLQWVNSGSDNNHDKAKTYITSWMKVYLDGDTAYAQYLDGSQDWFYDFAHNADSGSGGGCN